MNSDQFCYWLQGFFELTDAKEVNQKQVEVIKEHLNLVETQKTAPVQTRSIYDLPQSKMIVSC